MNIKIESLGRPKILRPKIEITQKGMKVKRITGKETFFDFNSIDTIYPKYVTNSSQDKLNLDLIMVFVLNNGERIGSVMIVDGGNHVAKLRLLLVEPKARGKGIGKQLVKECIDFSKRNGYRKITLWTQSILKEARHLYSKFGFEVVEEKPHTSFGHDLVAETWELDL